ncbi:MAG: J domain-containing protein [Bryobacteraceae bacterium]
MNRERSLEILELKPGASPEEVRQAYHDLVQVWHPDRFVGNERMHRLAEEKLRELNEAYKVLQSSLSPPPVIAPDAQNVNAMDMERSATQPFHTQPSSTQSPDTRRNPFLLLGIESMRQRWILILAAALLLGLGGWMGNRIFDSLQGSEASSTAPQPGADAVSAGNASGGASSGVMSPRVNASQKRDNASIIETPPSTSPLFMDPSVPAPQGSVPGDTGEIDVRNELGSEATLAILSTRSPKQILTRSPLPAGGSVVLRGLIPDSYWVDVSVAGYGQSPLRLGPFAIVRTSGEKGASADRYEVHLRPQSKP